MRKPSALPLALASAFFAVAYAQTPQPPECATNCLVQHNPSLPQCIQGGGNIVACLCSPDSSYFPLVVECINTNCEDAESRTIASYLNEDICAATSSVDTYPPTHTSQPVKETPPPEEEMTTATDCDTAAPPDSTEVPPSYSTEVPPSYSTGVPPPDKSTVIVPPVDTTAPVVSPPPPVETTGVVSTPGTNTTITTGAPPAETEPPAPTETPGEVDGGAAATATGSWALAGLVVALAFAGFF